MPEGKLTCFLLLSVFFNRLLAGAQKGNLGEITDYKRHHVVASYEPVGGAVGYTCFL